MALADVVGTGDVQALVGEPRARVLFGDAAGQARVGALIIGRSAEVEVITGVPVPDLLLPLARRAVTLGVVADLELAVAQEQTIDDVGPAEQWQRRYVAVLAELRGASSAVPGVPAGQPVHFAGSLPLSRYGAL